jgi:hypothetical protein
LCDYGLTGQDTGLEEALQALRAADAKQRLTFLLNRAAALAIGRGDLEQALRSSTEALQLAEVMERPTEMLLARINIERVRRLRNGPGDKANLESIAGLSAGPVAAWARQRATALLQAAQ